MQIAYICVNANKNKADAHHKEYSAAWRQQGRRRLYGSRPATRESGVPPPNSDERFAFHEGFRNSLYVQTTQKDTQVFCVPFWLAHIFIRIKEFERSAKGATE